MFCSLALLFLVGLSLGAIAQRLRLPRLVGLLLGGILLGPYVLDWLDPTLLGISTQLRQLALVIILLRAGLSLNLRDLRAVGRPALLLSFVPACCELLGYVLVAPLLFDLTRGEAALMGAVLSAVSPAVVVPRMVRLMDEGRGTAQRIPQMILAGASLDDVFVIVLFSSFLGLVQGEALSALSFGRIPVSILLGVAVGALVGLALAVVLRRVPEAVPQCLVVLSLALLLTWAEDLLPLSGLLAVMAMACLLQQRSPAPLTRRLSGQYGALWQAAELWLFVLVGAAVDVRYTWAAGWRALVLIALALAFRSLGVLLCMVRTPLSRRERLFCAVAYLPKATVQAAIGGLPLAAGLPCGSLILSVAVLGILTTAPLGAFAIDRLAPRWLSAEPQ